MARTAIFPGSFSPFTKGHADIVQRALQLFDHLVLGVGINSQKEGDGQAHVEALRALYVHDDRVTVEAYSDLTIDLAHRHHACCIVRGVRSVKDYEYELQMADVNRRVGGIDTVLLMASPQWAFLSSSMVRELEHFGHDVSEFLP